MTDARMSGPTERTLQQIGADHRMVPGEGQGAWGGGLCEYDGEPYPCDTRRVIRAKLGDLRRALLPTQASDSPEPKETR